MIPSLPINERHQTGSCWLAARPTQARIHPLNCKRTAPANTLRNPPRARSQRHAHPPESAKTTLRLSRLHPTSTAALPKSP
jgi:hypothetical protein